LRGSARALAAGRRRAARLALPAGACASPGRRRAPREAALEEARDALIAAGNRETAGEAAAFLARAAWHRGGRDEAFSHLARAEELVAAAPASAAKARVLATSARQRTLAGESQEGIRLGEQALDLAERFELAELEAHA